MTKAMFLDALRRGLCGMPNADIEERLTFYSEMIDDRMEEGMEETAAVAAVGDVEEILSQIVADTPLTTLVKHKITPKQRLRAWKIVLLILGSPVWLSLLLAALAIVFSLYAALWSVVVSLWAVFVSVIGCAVGGILAGVVFACSGNTPVGVAMFGVALLLAGLSIFLFLGCKAATKSTLLLAKQAILGFKNRCVRKEAA